MEFESFRKKPVPYSKKVKQVEMTDIQAFEHFLQDMQATKYYPNSTLKTWRWRLKKGTMKNDTICRILKENNYYVKSERRWCKRAERKK